jgi:hypothetical protein
MEVFGYGNSVKMKRPSALTSKKDSLNNPRKFCLRIMLA